MPAVKVFNAVVAARTRAAQQILSTPQLLAMFVALGGLPADLEELVAAGREAEAHNHNQGAAFSDGKVATVTVQTTFGVVQRDYMGLLAVLRAILGKLRREKAEQAIITRLEDIIENRAAVIVTEDAEDDPTKPAKKSAKRSGAHEAVRAEIERDATDLLKFSEIAAVLTARKWPTARLTKLQTDARALTGKLGTRAATKGAAKDASAKERAAVAMQSSAWDSTYSLLASLGRQDARVAALLKEASR